MIEKYESVKCKAKVFDGFRWGGRGCSRNAVNDGFCKQHHPDTQKERNKKSQEKYEEKVKQSASYKLKIATEENAKLREQNAKLVAALGKARSTMEAVIDDPYFRDVSQYIGKQDLEDIDSALKEAGE